MTKGNTPLCPMCGNTGVINMLFRDGLARAWRRCRCMWSKDYMRYVPPAKPKRTTKRKVK